MNPTFARRPRTLAALALCALQLVSGRASAQAVTTSQDASTASFAEAWWTGPMIANSASTLPQGHALIEPYLFDRLGRNSNSYGSLVYMLYGLTDDLTIGVSPTFGYNTISKGEASSGPSLGDVTLRAQYALLHSRSGSTAPALAFALGYTLPTGKFDKLGQRPGDGIGGGAHVLTASLYEQNVFRMPNGRPLRVRLNLSYSITGNASLADVSVYGTDQGFRGRARQSSTIALGGSLEYSVSRSWALALDALWIGGDRIDVDGMNLLSTDPKPIHMVRGDIRQTALAPGIEYSWTPNLGILLAARFITHGHNVRSSVTPAIAFNAVI